MLKLHLKKKTITIISFISLFSVTLAATVSATVCWFNSYLGTKATVQNIAVISKEEAQDFNISYKVLKFNESSKKGVQHKNEAGNYTFELDSFDAFIDTRNDYLSQIMEIKITTTADNSFGGFVYFDINRLQNFVSSTSNLKVASYISNLVKFDACLYSYTIKGQSPVKFFEFGDVNRYKYMMDPDKPVSYGGDVDDQTYQEVRYYLDNSTNLPHFTYVSEDAVGSLPSSDDPGFEDAMLEINKNKNSSVNFRVDQQRGSTYRIPNNYTEAIFYLRFDYSKVLSSFYAKNQNATVYVGGAVAVENDITKINVGLRHQ